MFCGDKICLYTYINARQNIRKYGGTNGLIVSAYVRLLRVRESDIHMGGVVYAIRLQRGPGMVLFYPLIP